VDGISFKVEMNLPGNYVLLNKMMTYSGPGVSTFAACGQLSPDGRSLGMVSKQGTIAKVGKLTVWVAGIIFKSLGNEAYAMVKVLPNGAFAQYPVKVIKPLQNARAIGAVAGAAAKKVFEQQCLKWESARSMRNETVFDSLPVSDSEDDEVPRAAPRSKSAAKAPKRTSKSTQEVVPKAQPKKSTSSTTAAPVGFKQQAKATKKKLTHDSSEDAPPSSDDDDADEEEDEATDISPKSKTRKRKQLEYQVRKTRQQDAEARSGAASSSTSSAPIDLASEASMTHLPPSLVGALEKLIASQIEVLAGKLLPGATPQNRSFVHHEPCAPTSMPLEPERKKARLQVIQAQAAVPLPVVHNTNNYVYHCYGASVPPQDMP